MEPNVQNVVNQPVTPLKTAKKTNFLPMIIVGIVMLLLGLGGGYLLFANKSDVKISESKEVVITVTPTPSPSATVSPQTSPVIEGTTFMIRDLGFQIQIPTDLKDLTYTATKVNGVDSVSFSTLSLTNLDKANGGNYCNSTNAGLGSISKSPQLGHDVSDYKQIGSYYYIWNHPQATCSDKKSVYELQTKQSAALGQAFKTLELIK